MKLDYKILWLDDKIQDFKDDEYIEEIKNHLISEEFNPIIDATNDQDEFYKYLSNNTYDLILTDFHLNETSNNKGIDGDVIVETVRKNNIFTEILFYTAKAPLQGKLTWDRISFLETATLPDEHHEEVIKKTKKLIDLTIEKFHDIVVMRGMIMNETSDFDNEKKALLKTFVSLEKYKDNVPQLRDRLFQEVDKFLIEKRDKIDDCVRNKNLNNLIKDNTLFSADKKISAMSEILQIIGHEDFSDDYRKEIINIRNDFAHANLEEEKDVDGKIIRKYFKKGDITFDQEYCKTIRANITKHKKNLKIIKDKLNE